MADFPVTLAPARLDYGTFIWPQFNYLGAALTLAAPTLSVVRAAGGAVFPPPQPLQAHSVRVDSEATPGFDWFERVHILPRVRQALGVIVSNLNVLFEVFNARRTPATLTAVTNPLTPGVTIPDLPALPLVLAPFASLLDPTSVSLSPVRIEALVARDGVPIFDGGIVFEFSSGDEPTLLLSGVRVAVIPLVYEADFDERLTFPSAAAEPQDGTNEQVLSLTANPVQAFGLTFLLGDEDRQRLQVLLFGSQAKVLGLPLWHEAIATTASVGALATSASVESTANVELRVGGYAVLFESATKFDVVQLATVSANSITFPATPLLYSYSTGILVVPLRLGAIVNPPSGSRLLNKLESIRLSFQVKDNDTGALTGSTAGWSAHASKVLLDDCNVVDGAQQETFTQRVTIIDNGVGAVQVVEDWDTDRRDSSKGFSMRSRAEYIKVKRLLIALRGPQRSFFIPTFAEDLTPAANLVATASTIDVVNIGYAKHVPTPTTPKATFRITFTDGTSLVRTILSAVALSDTVEQLQLDAAWPANRTVAEIVRIEFFELSRFASQTFTFQHTRIGLVKLVAAVKTLLA